MLNNRYWICFYLFHTEKNNCEFVIKAENTQKKIWMSSLFKNKWITERHSPSLTPDKNFWVKGIFTHGPPLCLCWAVPASPPASSAWSINSKGNPLSVLWVSGTRTVRHHHQMIRPIIVSHSSGFFGHKNSWPWIKKWTTAPSSVYYCVVCVFYNVL